MEAIGRGDKGLGGTGWQARSVGKEIIETDTWQGFGCDNRLAKKSSPVAGGNATGDKLGRRRDLALPPSNGEEDRHNPVCRRDGDAPVGKTTAGAMRRACLLKAGATHETPALPWAETTAVDARDAANPSGRTGISGDPERCVLVAGRTAAPPARRDGAHPINVAEEETPRIRAPQANIQPTVSGGISAITSPHCSAQTTGGSGAGAAYKEPDT